MSKQFGIASCRTSDVNSRPTKWDISFKLNIGDQERHQVEFRWAQWKLEARFIMDGNEVFYDRTRFGLRMSKKYEIRVGDSEVHTVAVVRRRHLPQSVFRKQDFSAYLDGQLVGEY